MKTMYSFKAGITLLLACMLSLTSEAQVAKVGIVRNGTPEVTDFNEAAKVLKGGLPDIASVTNIQIIQEPESGKFFLVGHILNASITGKAVELQDKGGQLIAASGPGLEITCTGFNCERCVPVIKKLKVRCSCEDPNPAPDARCDMTSKLVLTAW